MRQYDIHIWGCKPDDPEELAFLVKQRQAVWAEYLLYRADVSLICQLLDHATRNM